MNNGIKRLHTLAAALVLVGSVLASPQVLGADKVLSGCYVPKRGYAESASVLPTEFNISPTDGEELSEQIGSYRVVLLREGYKALTLAEKATTVRRLVLQGPFRGRLFPNGTLDHVLASRDRKGLLFTSGDTFIAPEDQVILCGIANDKLLFVLEGTEYIYPISGTGQYQALQQNESNFAVYGTVNQCTGLNDFEVVAGEGALCFGP